MLVNLLVASLKVAKYTFILLYSYLFFSMDSPVWPVRDRILSLQTQWFTLIGEQLQVPEGPLLEYWRVKKSRLSHCSTDPKSADYRASAHVSPWRGKSYIGFSGRAVPR
jgi:hypothetical protein